MVDVDAEVCKSLRQLKCNTNFLASGRSRSYRPPRRQSRIPLIKYANLFSNPIWLIHHSSRALHSMLYEHFADSSHPDFNDPQTNNRSKIPPSSLPSAFDPSSSAPSKRFLWTLSFYAQFFDVDTSDVFHRCKSSLYPRAPFLDILDGNPDLYGPFWIATTVVFILFITGTISQYLAANHDIHFEYDFKLLSGAAGLVYGYTGLVPIALWGALRWFGAESMTLVETWALYGYANCIWIPVALCSWSPLSGLNYAVVGVGFAWSVAFLVRNLWLAVSGTEQKILRGLVLLVVVLHFGLAVAIKFTFFA